MISMNKIKTALRRLKFKLKHDFLTVENLILVFAIALCLVWTFQSIGAMSRNWALSEKLAEEKRNLELIKLEVETKELENEYYKTEEYQELLARKYSEKMLSGENMVVMPANSEEAKNKHSQVYSVEVPKEERSNFEKWMAFLFPSF